MARYCNCTYFTDEKNEAGRGGVTHQMLVAPEQPMLHPGRLAPGLSPAVPASNYTHSECTAIYAARFQLYNN